MGVDFRTDGNGAEVPQYEDLRRARFGEYFPRLFAYAQACTGDDDQACEIVVEAFSRAFAQPKELDDRSFRVVLFSVTRQLCQERPSRRASDSLSSREREVISLIFDAQLRRDEIACLLNVKTETVTSTLVRGLKKLRDSFSGVAPALVTG